MTLRKLSVVSVPCHGLATSSWAWLLRPGTDSLCCSLALCAAPWTLVSRQSVDTPNKFT